MLALLGILLFIVPLWADVGVLIPGDKQLPDPAILSLEETSININADQNGVRVLIRQIFRNRTSANLEGNYIFSLPGSAIVSDFAVWDGPTRIAGVILERKRAEEIYKDIRLQSLDPGLLQMGERDADQAQRSAIFSARVVPISAYGTKRVEIEYHDRLAVENLASLLAVPLRPSAYKSITTGRLWITMELKSKHALRNFELISKTYPFKTIEQTANLVRASLEVPNFTFNEDFAVRWSYDPAKTNQLEIASYRDAQENPTEPGFFRASTVLAPTTAVDSAPRTVVALLDASLSMQWEKLELSYRALETLLKSLRPTDKFNIVVFNSQAALFQPAVATASSNEIERALTWVKSNRLRGGTNLKAALEAGLGQSGPNSYLVLLTDGGATEGVSHPGSLVPWYESAWNRLPAANRPRTFVLAVGDDANPSNLKPMARLNGVFEWIRSSEPAEFKLNAFLGKIGRKPIDGLGLSAEPKNNFDLIYPLQDAPYSGTMPAWVGQYKKPGRGNFAVQNARASVALPDRSLDHPQLPRTWAKARVDALLEKIDREGEDKATIEEIIRLSRKYKFVTPYTSFLAAPRALLRPRLIRPGDPVLRIHADPSIVSIVALFSFGIVKPLKFLSGENVWQTRFLAPSDLPDGTHPVRLILRDREGRVYKEQKTFVIFSKAPLVRAKLDKARYRHGEAVQVKAFASESARTIVARLHGAEPAFLKWNPQALASTGSLIIPADLPPGTYKVQVSAEDMAHNISSQEVSLEILP